MTIDLMTARHISIAVARPAAEVGAFLGDPANMVRWATGLGTTMRPSSDDTWTAEGSLGTVTIRFTPANPHGVHDHEVELSTGERVLNPMRVLANGGGSEVVFTLFHRPGMTTGDFDRDTAWVRRDLETLKALLEGACAGLR